ncbi:hypothetical protein WJX74_008490 [Apatococcus lobatus]|uniref:Uncharacterized protein n=1 Tax=Apatococcus lobatus TaxID=904363 RepID=A0AAW1S141_9CHLO
MASNDLQLKQLAAAEKQVSETQQCKDPPEELKQVGQCSSTDDRRIEECVTQAIASVLQNGVIILPSRYIFKSAAGDLDGLLAGHFKNKPVIVLVEAKHNMDTLWKKAKDQLFQAKHHCERLASSVAEELDESDLADYKAMQMNNLRDNRVMFGFGGLNFSKEIVNKHLANIQIGCFYVQANTSGRFVTKTVS